MTSAVVFPGMGPAVFPDLAKFMLVNPYSRDLVSAADNVLGYSLFDRCQEAKGDYNPYTQIAFVVNCLAFAQWAADRLGMRPDLVAGPSFGGRAAAAYSGAVGFDEVVWLTAELARVMDEYFAVRHQDVVTHSFVRTSPEELTVITAELASAGEWYELSCHIDDDFYLLSLGGDQVEWLRGRLAAVGGLSLYTMRPPMHASIFADLRDRVDAEIFSRITWHDPAIPVVADQDGSLLFTGQGVRSMLLDGFVKAVRWPSVVATLRRQDVSKVYVSGPDSMFGRVACTTRNFEVVALNPRSIRNL